jgi:hypothetical protein
MKIKLLDPLVDKRKPENDFNEQLKPGDVIIVESTDHLQKAGVKFVVMKEPEVAPVPKDSFKK